MDNSEKEKIQETHQTEDTLRNQPEKIDNSTTNSQYFLVEKKRDDPNLQFNISTDDSDRKPINKLLLTLCVLIGILFLTSLCYIAYKANFTDKQKMTKYDLQQEFNVDYQVGYFTQRKKLSLCKDVPITITESLFGITAKGEEVKLYTLKNQVGLELSLISFGASVQSLKVNDGNGKAVNVILGLDSIEEYENPIYNRHFGGIVGRTSNRISNSEFTLDGVKYTLDKNNGVNSLHGGNHGFDMRNWKSNTVKDGIRFEIFSQDLEGGYPGDVTVEVIYRISSDRNEIFIEYRANTTKPTPIDLTNHAYFNLNGQTSNIPIYNHEFRLFCDNYLPSNSENSIVTGDIKPVRGTKYCFHNFVRLGDRVEVNGSWPEQGFDNFFLINQNSGHKHVASIKNPENRLQFDIFSDQNGVQFYTGNYLNVIKLNGQRFDRHSGFCLETHNYPNAVNIPHFPSAIVRPEGEYRQSTKWIFTTY